MLWRRKTMDVIKDKILSLKLQICGSCSIIYLFVATFFSLRQCCVEPIYPRTSSFIYPQIYIFLPCLTNIFFKWFDNCFSPSLLLKISHFLDMYIKNRTVFPISLHLDHINLVIHTLEWCWRMECPINLHHMNRVS